jgi:hypothetical protein
LIKIAAVAGALICGLLLVVALGCTCKLYNLRVNGRFVVDFYFGIVFLSVTVVSLLFVVNVLNNLF